VRRSEAEVVAVNVPVGPVGATALLQALPASDAFLFGVQGQAQSAVGSVRRLLAHGDDRMAALRTWSEAVFAELEVVPWPGAEPVPPKLHGGLAFAPGDSTADGWEGFGDGQVTLPRFSLVSEGDQATLTVVVDRARDTLPELLPTVGRVLESLRQPQAIRREQPVRILAVEQLSRARWRELIDDILAAIATDGFDKIVAARRARVVGARSFDDLTVFRRLVRAYPGCHLFLVRRGGRSFVGATPETLFTTRDGQLETHALAGSWVIEPGGSEAEAAAALLGSAKNVWEHEVVHRRIVDALTPLATGVRSEARKTLRLRNLLHLDTPVRATLRPGTHATQVLHALHPTPAVGGLPKWPAVEWIRAHEPAPRGWYTGTVGWFDAAGNATFTVAIRCALLCDSEAWVYTGAGIVADSQPDAEYDETAVKQQPLFRALGIG